jgi:hypothetical protein
VPRTALLREPRAAGAEVVPRRTVAAHPDRRSALAGLRAEIEHEIRCSGGGTPDWDTLVLVGPVPLREGEGRYWFDYVLSVACRPCAPATGDGSG